MTELSERLEQFASSITSKRRAIIKEKREITGKKVKMHPDALSQLTNDVVDEIIRTKDWEGLGVFLKLLITHEHPAKFRGLL